jgi:hypothetical protein
VKNDFLKLCPNDCLRDKCEITNSFLYKANREKTQISSFIQIIHQLYEIFEKRAQKFSQLFISNDIVVL